MPSPVLTRRIILPGPGSDFITQVRRICGNSLIGLWLLNEQSGSVAKDYSGFGRDGSYTGVTLLQPGVALGANMGFETGGPDFGTWVETAGDGAVEVEGTLVNGGAQAAKLTAGASANTKIAQTFTLIPWAKYKTGLYSAGDGTNGGRYGIYDVTNSADIVAATATGQTAAAYAVLTKDFSAPGGCISGRLDLWCPTANGGIAYFDDTSLYASQPNGVRGFTAPYFDGALDYVSWSGAALTSLQSAFNGAEGTLAGWTRVGSSGVWADATVRYMAHFGVDADNYVYIARTATNNTIRILHKGGGVAKFVDVTVSDTTWLMFALTWSLSANQVKVYLNGVQRGNTQTGVGTWAGTLAAASTVIGAISTTPTNAWSGLINAPLVCNRALSPAAIRALYQASLPVAA